jgi:hypothetical protein
MTWNEWLAKLLPQPEKDPEEACRRAGFEPDAFRDLITEAVLDTLRVYSFRGEEPEWWPVWDDEADGFVGAAVVTLTLAELGEDTLTLGELRRRSSAELEVQAGDRILVRLFAPSAWNPNSFPAPQQWKALFHIEAVARVAERHRVSARKLRAAWVRVVTLLMSRALRGADIECVLDEKQGVIRPLLKLEVMGRAVDELREVGQRELDEELAKRVDIGDVVTIELSAFTSGIERWADPLTVRRVSARRIFRELVAWLGPARFEARLPQVPRRLDIDLEELWSSRRRVPALRPLRAPGLPVVDGVVTPVSRDTLREAGFDAPDLETLLDIEGQPSLVRFFRVPRQRVREVWAALHALAPRTQIWPVVLGHTDHDLESGHSAAPQLVYEAARALDLGAWYAERTGGGDYYKLEPPVPWPENVRPFEPFAALAAEKGKEPSELAIGLVPAARPWLVPAFFTGGWNEYPPAEVHVALLHRWYELHGAVVRTWTHDEIELCITRPPGSREEALALAEELYVYCADTVQQGLKNVETLAAKILKAPCWQFWWD